jgi:hypothetical protein
MSSQNIGDFFKIGLASQKFSPEGMTNHVRNEVPISGDGRLRYGFGAD